MDNDHTLPEPDPNQERSAAEIMAAWDAADESFFDRQRIQVEVSLDARDHAARTADALEKMANLLADIADAIIEAYGDGGHAK